MIVLHDRRVPGRGRANIDHIAIGLAGVTVIDTKSSRGRVQLATAGIINRREQLLVNGRDRTSQLDALERQVERVAAPCSTDTAPITSAPLARSASRSCGESGFTTATRGTG